ncbi:hypothetical protein BKA64DRAFT_708120 [Cadophora sp. MPI-SDFR-AT-0126]|nr:hypothetical protein BKA64DRAFT_708120 [Leotiomycetes sp. MPI-SDFR-AT-0126]
MEKVTASTAEHGEALPRKTVGVEALPRRIIAGGISNEEEGSSEIELGTVGEEPAPVHGDQTNNGGKDTTSVERMSMSQKPVLVNANQANATEINTTRTGHTTTSEELVTIPVMKLQQLVEFCAQVLRESRCREASAPDLEIGAPVIGPPDIMMDPLDAVGNYLFKDEDFKVGSWTLAPYEIPSQFKAEVENLWDLVETFPIRRLVTTKESKFVKTITESCLTIADLPVLFKGLRGEMGADAESIEEIFEMSAQLSGRDSFDWKLMAAVCASGVNAETLGDIMQQCYCSGALQRPIDSEASSHTAYMLDISRIVEHVGTFNRIFRFQYRTDFGYLNSTREGSRMLIYSWLRPLFVGRSLEELLALPLFSLIRLLYLAAPKPTLEANDIATGTTFRLDDLNVRSLASLGDLHVIWTSILENHLLLDLRNKTLSIVWQVPYACKFSPVGRWEWAMARSVGIGFCGLSQPFSGGPYQLNEEVRRTWAFLFATNSSFEKRCEDYASVDGNSLMVDSNPYHLLKSYQHLRKRHLGEDMDNYRYEGYRDVFKAARNKALVPYAQFPVFENRLRQLRHYMDSQKPRGIRQLWKDKRDTLNYYTFWGVIIFGSLSIFLAFFSLAVSIAQTVASFKALNAS